MSQKQSTVLHSLSSMNARRKQLAPPTKSQKNQPVQEESKQDSIPVNDSQAPMELQSLNEQQIVLAPTKQVQQSQIVLFNNDKKFDSNPILEVFAKEKNTEGKVQFKSSTPEERKKMALTFLPIVQQQLQGEKYYKDKYNSAHTINGDYSSRMAQNEGELPDFLDHLAVDFKTVGSFTDIIPELLDEQSLPAVNEKDWENFLSYYLPIAQTFYHFLPEDKKPKDAFFYPSGLNIEIVGATQYGFQQIRIRMKLFACIYSPSAVQEGKVTREDFSDCSKGATRYNILAFIDPQKQLDHYKIVKDDIASYFQLLEQFDYPNLFNTLVLREDRAKNFLTLLKMVSYVQDFDVAENQASISSLFVMINHIQRSIEKEKELEKSKPQKQTILTVPRFLPSSDGQFTSLTVERSIHQVRDAGLPISPSDYDNLATKTSLTPKIDSMNRKSQLTSFSEAEKTLKVGSKVTLDKLILTGTEVQDFPLITWLERPSSDNLVKGKQNKEKEKKKEEEKQKKEAVKKSRVKKVESFVEKFDRLKNPQIAFNVGEWSSKTNTVRPVDKKDPIYKKQVQLNFADHKKIWERVSKHFFPDGVLFDKIIKGKSQDDDKGKATANQLSPGSAVAVKKQQTTQFPIPGFPKFNFKSNTVVAEVQAVLPLTDFKKKKDKVVSMLKNAGLSEEQTLNVVENTIAKQNRIGLLGCEAFSQYNKFDNESSVFIVCFNTGTTNCNIETFTQEILKVNKEKILISDIVSIVEKNPAYGKMIGFLSTVPIVEIAPKYVDKCENAEQVKEALFKKTNELFSDTFSQIKEESPVFKAAQNGLIKYKVSDSSQSSFYFGLNYVLYDSENKGWVEFTKFGDNQKIPTSIIHDIVGLKKIQKANDLHFQIFSLKTVKQQKIVNLQKLELMIPTPFVKPGNVIRTLKKKGDITAPHILKFFFPPSSEFDFKNATKEATPFKDIFFGFESIVDSKKEQFKHHKEYFKHFIVPTLVDEISKNYLEQQESENSEQQQKEKTSQIVDYIQFFIPFKLGKYGFEDKKSYLYDHEPVFLTCFKLMIQTLYPAEILEKDIAKIKTFVPKLLFNNFSNFIDLYNEKKLKKLENPVDKEKILSSYISEQEFVTVNKNDFVSSQIVAEDLFGKLVEFLQEKNDSGLTPTKKKFESQKNAMQIFFRVVLYVLADDNFENSPYYFPQFKTRVDYDEKNYDDDCSLFPILEDRKPKKKGVKPTAEDPIDPKILFDRLTDVAQTKLEKGTSDPQDIFTVGTYGGFIKLLSLIVRDVFNQTLGSKRGNNDPFYALQSFDDFLNNDIAKKWFTPNIAQDQDLRENLERVQYEVVEMPVNTTKEKVDDMDEDDVIDDEDDSEDERTKFSLPDQEQNRTGKLTKKVINEDSDEDSDSDRHNNDFEYVASDVENESDDENEEEHEPKEGSKNKTKRGRSKKLSNNKRQKKLN